VKRISAPVGMDPNLVKIRDSCMYLIQKGLFAKTIAHAKDYLVQILGEYRMLQVNQELDIYVDHLYELAGPKAPPRKRPQFRGVTTP